MEAAAATTAAAFTMVAVTDVDTMEAVADGAKKGPRHYLQKYTKTR